MIIDNFHSRFSFDCLSIRHDDHSKKTELIDKYLISTRRKIILFFFDENESCAKDIDNFHNGYYIRNGNFRSRLSVSTEKYKLARVSLSNVFVSFLSRESNSMRKSNAEKKKKNNIVGSRETRNETFVLKGRKNCAYRSQDTQR